MNERDPARALVGIVGDFTPENPTHRATNQALADADLRFEWVPTVEVVPARPEQRLAAYDGLFIAPASPYRSMEGALAAIRFARERGVPLVGT
jgi:CTP synthase (UTP-ammonia lyase)